MRTHFNIKVDVNESCRKCGHRPSFHGSCVLATDYISKVFLCCQYPCAGLLEDNNTLCKCPWFAPQDNLSYLEQLYEQTL